jgi:hypothetical protein
MAESGYYFAILCRKVRMADQVIGSHNAVLLEEENKSYPSMMFFIPSTSCITKFPDEFMYKILVNHQRNF